MEWLSRRISPEGWRAIGRRDDRNLTARRPGNDHWNDPSHHPDTCTDRCIADVALQQRMGLRPQWFRRLDRRNTRRAVADESDLACLASASSFRSAEPKAGTRRAARSAFFFLRLLSA